MKRVITFDFLRGIAIIGVLLFHVFNIAFAQQAKYVTDAIDNGDPLEPYWYAIAIPLMIFGAFNGMFLMISAASNAISVNKQWLSMVVTKNMDKTIVFKKILGSQVLRGALIWVFGFISEGILATLLGDWMKVVNYLDNPANGLPDPFWYSLLKGFFFTNILYTIGISLIITSFIQLVYLKSGKPRAMMAKVLLLVAIVCIALMPVIQKYIYPLFDNGVDNTGTDTFSNNLFGIDSGELIARLILTPFIGRLTPLIPYFSCAAIGLLFSVHINERAITPEFLQKMFWLGVIFVGCAIPIGAVFGFDIGQRERSIFFMTFITGFEIICTTWMIYMVDFRRKTRLDLFLKTTVWLRRFGVMTLTLWMLQYTMVFPIILIELVTGWPIVGLPAGVLPGGLNGWQLGIVLLCMLGMWHLVLLAWERGRFIGSLEWITAHALSKGSTSGDRLNIGGIFHDVERMIEWVPGKKDKRAGLEKET